MNDETSRPWMKVIARAEPRFNEIAAADGNLVLFQREAMFAHQAFEKPGADYLRSCEPESLFNAIINVASVGLTLSPAEKLAYLVPRAEGKGKDRRVLCCLDISYRGLKKIAEDTGSVRTAVADVVRAADDFEWFDKLTKPRHKYDPFATRADRGDVRGAYCMAVLPDGIVQVEALSMEDLKKIRDCSKASDGPWVDWWDEMAKKSAVRRASKMWPHAKRLQEAMNILDQHQGLIDVDHQLEATAPVPQPTPAAPAADGAPPPPAPEKKEEKKQPAGPMQPGQMRIIKARAKAAEIDEARIWKKFGPLEALTFDDFDRIQTWIKEGGPE